MPVARTLVRLLRTALRWLGHGIVLLQAGFSYLLDGSHGLERLLLEQDRHQSHFLLRILGASVGVDCDLESPIEIHNSAGFSRLTIGDGVHR